MNPKMFSVLLATILLISFVSAFDICTITRCKEAKMDNSENVSDLRIGTSKPLFFWNLNHSFGRADALKREQSLRINFGNEPTMIFYPNGSFWIKNGTEQYNGEQLAKVAIAYGSYTRGYCEGVLK